MKFKFSFIICFATFLIPFETKGQHSKYDLYIGFCHMPVEKYLHSFGLSAIIDNKTRWQFEPTVFYTKEFSNLPRYAIIGKFDVNMYIRKRTENSRKVFGMCSIELFYEYYKRNYELILKSRLINPVERNMAGILGALSLNYRPLQMLHFKTEIMYGPCIYEYSYLQYHQSYRGVLGKIEFSFYYKF